MTSKFTVLSEFREITSSLPGDTVIFLGTWNGYSETYAVADHIFTCDYEEIRDDFFGTRGKMDKRLFSRDLIKSDDSKILYIGTMFNKNIDNPDIDFPDNPNEPIKLINGPTGDPDLFWKSNGFKYHDQPGYWLLGEQDWTIIFWPGTDTLEVKKPQCTWTGICIGLEDFFDITKACKIDHIWRIG